VHRAHDELHNRLVAVKMLKDDGAGNNAKRQERAARFKAEFDILKRLSHCSKVVRAYEFFESEDSAPFFTLEFLQGETLAEMLLSDSWLTKTPAAKISLAIDLLSQIARSLSDVHRCGIIFCDLKPANIMVLDDGMVLHDSAGNLQITLFDFGIAREISLAVSAASSAAASSAASSAMVGTSFYMAPEQIQGATLDSRVDIYAFGVLAFEMLTGRKPFDDTVLFNVTASHLASNVPAMRKIVPEIPAALERMVRIGMEKKATDRYATMQEICERLNSISGRSDVGAAGSSMLNRLKRLFKRSV